MASNGLCAVRSRVAGIRERTVRSTHAAEAVAELGSLIWLENVKWAVHLRSGKSLVSSFSAPWLN
jgi:hypothetical protein